MDEDSEDYHPEDDQEFLDEYFGGDKEKLREAIKEGRRYAIAWKDIDAYGSILTEHQEQANQIIENLLGYMTNYAFYVPFEPAIRQEIERLKLGQSTQEAFDDAVYKIVMQVRNLDMERDGWCDPLSFNDDDLNRYTFYLAPYINTARERLARFLGYYPDLCHSLQAEIYIREFLCEHNVNPLWSESAFDYKAMTVVKYREVLLSEGKDAADRSPLIGLRE